MQKYQNNVQNTFGDAVSGVTVTIRTNPGGVLATIFSDNGVTGKANPFTNDSDGEFFFYAANGRYNIELSGPITETKSDVLLLDVATSGGNPDVIADIVTATPPTTEAVTALLSYRDLDSTDLLADVGFNAVNTFGIRNRMHGGQVLLTGEDAGGTLRTGLAFDPDNTLSLTYAGTTRVRTAASGVLEIASDGDTDGEVRGIRLTHQDGTVRGRLEFLSGSSIIALRQEVHGSAIYIEGEDAGGSIREMIIADPDVGVDIYAGGGEKRFATYANGEANIHADGNTDTENIILRFAHADGTDRGWVGNTTDGSTRLSGLVHGAPIIITAEDAGGTPRTILSADPDATTTLRADTDIALQVSAGTTALSCVGGGKVGMYWNGQENFRTSDESAADIHMGAEVRHYDDNFYPVGMNVAPEIAALDSGNETLHRDNVGKMLTYNTGTARSLLMNNDGTLKVGSMWALKVGPSAGTLTGDGGTGVQIRWWNGTGWTTTAAAGNITIGVGSYTIWKETDTLYWIDGPTLS